jgi:hypothetical protein
MKLRLLPVVISVVVSATVLFGGWFTYNSFAMEHPLSDVINQAPGVTHSSINLGSDAVTVDLTLKPDADLREIVHKIMTDGSSIIGKRQLDIHTTNAAPELEAWWSRALFDVAQAMETKHYAAIPTTLQDKANAISGLKVDTQMDGNYVYVRLTDGTNSKFIMLPRSSAKMGVWPNE